MFKYFVLFTLLFLNLNDTAHSQASKKNILSQHKKELSQIENYLNNIKFLNADFIQESENGDIARGKLFLARPGKMRIEYKSPQKLSIVVNNSVLAYSDLELEETSYLTTNSTPASFLTRKNFSFSAIDIEVTDFKKYEHSIKVSLLKKNKKSAGIFSLVFQTNPLKFVQMAVKNDLDETTKVYFTNSIFGQKIDDDLFVIKNNNQFTN
jgi:outer membrane lipoprotein-sorting protein